MDLSEADEQRKPRQVAGSPVSEADVGGRPPRGAKLPARLPQPHLGQGNGAEGSALVHPALSVTRCTSSSEFSNTLYQIRHICLPSTPYLNEQSQIKNPGAATALAVKQKL